MFEYGMIQGWEMLQKAEFSQKAAKDLSVTVIQTIDLFLVGALGYITAVGLYKLFISQKEEQLLKRIKIDSLIDLENKIIGVVVAALAVAFLGEATVVLPIMRDDFWSATVGEEGVFVVRVISANGVSDDYADNVSFYYNDDTSPGSEGTRRKGDPACPVA